MTLSATAKRPARSAPTNSTTAPQRIVPCSLVAIPVRLDQTPGQICWSDRCYVNESGARVAFDVDRKKIFPGRAMVVGVAFPGQQRRFTMATIRSQRKTNAGLRVEVAQQQDSSEDLLSDQNLTPRIDASHFRFEYRYAEDILMQWESIGVLRQYLVDRVLVCPGCGSIPTWRYGCPKCGSARYSRDRLIHHFACAHVDHAEVFQPDGDALRCPKCRATRLIAGTDFQYIPGPLNCFDCDASGCQGVLCCMCHQCQDRFDPNEARELDLYGYHVDRLDLLDIVAASQ